MRIAIAHSNTLIIEAIVNLLAAFPSFEIIWIARNKNEAINRALENNPDLLLLDIDIKATDVIMEKSPCTILLVLQGPMDQHMTSVFEAMGQGAIDVVSLAGIEKGTATYLGDLMRKIESIGRILGLAQDHPRETSVQPKARASGRVPLLLIGASTGGPAALVKLFHSFSGNNPFATVLIQHIDDKFSSGMATWLQNQTGTPVQLLQAESHPIPGTIFLASQRNHIVVSKTHELTYSTHPVNHVYTPSIDVLFISAAQHWVGQGFGVLLTGMGDDGARGLRVLRDAGWHTYAQDQSSCVVFGMPKAAIELDAVEHVLSIEEIGPALLKQYNKSHTPLFQS